MTRTEYRRTLRFYTLYRDRNPTTFDVLRYNAWVWVYWWIVGGCVYLLLDRWVSPSVAVTGAAVFAGAALRDLRYCSSVARRWPQLRELLDWGRIDEALAKDQGDAR